MGTRQMREILFRGKRVDNGEWVYGNYIHTDCYKEANDYIRQNETFGHAVDPSTVGQYIGLTEKNGKKIFEGDIVAHVKFPDEPALICWHETGFAIKGLWYESDISRYIKHIEVIGNIHDNPELIGGAKQ